jgi:bifunctional non-homologous end joining protein LigD
VAGARRRAGAASHAGGYDYTKRYPWITNATCKVRQKKFLIDGDDVNGVSDFNALHSRRRQIY